MSDFKEYGKHNRALRDAAYRFVEIARELRATDPAKADEIMAEYEALWAAKEYLTRRELKIIELNALQRLKENAA